jgi:hypothetical protein
VNGLPSNPFATASQAVVAQLTQMSIAARAPFFASSNLAMARRVFQRVGGFDASFCLAAGEDRDLCDRCLAQGIQLVHAPEAIVDHFNALSLGSFLRQHFRYGRAACRFHRLRRARSAASGPGAPRFYVDLVRGAMQTPNGQPRPQLGLVAVSQIAVGLGYFVEHVHAHPASAPSEWRPQRAEREVPRGAKATVDEER